MITPSSAWMRRLCVLVPLAGMGCSATAPPQMPADREHREMVALMLPDRIEIKPFTKVASFDDDDTPDGILAVIRPVDRFGDPAKAVGFFYFQLWSYQQASGDRRGELLAQWDVAVGNESEVREYWTRGQMYQFPLTWPEDIEEIPPARKYLFTATYHAPWDRNIEAEYELDITVPAGMKPLATGD